MAKVSPIEQELRDAADVTPKSKEKRQDFLRRLALAVQKLPDEDWEKLSNPAQLWNNAASELLKADKASDVKDFEEEDAEAGEEEEDDKPKGKVKKPAAGKSKAKASPPKKSEKTTRAASEFNADGVKVRIKKLIIGKPDISAEAIVDALTKKGESPSRFTVASIRAEFRHSLKVLQMEGMLPKSFKI